MLIRNIPVVSLHGSGTLRTEPYKETRRQRKFHRPLNDKPPLLELVPTLTCRILSRISLSTQIAFFPLRSPNFISTWSCGVSSGCRRLYSLLRRRVVSSFNDLYLQLLETKIDSGSALFSCRLTGSKYGIHHSSCE